MPQVAARINDEQERWLKDYFRTKSAGAEFILPWAVDTFFRAMANIKQMFTAGELKTIVEAHKDTRLLPDHTRLSYLLLRVSDACELNNLHTAWRQPLQPGKQAQKSGRHPGDGPYGLGIRFLGEPELFRRQPGRIHQRLLTRTPCASRAFLLCFFFITGPSQAFFSAL